MQFHEVSLIQLFLQHEGVHNDSGLDFGMDLGWRGWDCLKIFIFQIRFLFLSELSHLYSTGWSIRSINFKKVFKPCEISSPQKRDEISHEIPPESYFAVLSSVSWAYFDFIFAVCQDPFFRTGNILKWSAFMATVVWHNFILWFAFYNSDFNIFAWHICCDIAGHFSDLVAV